jgi:hypothetical protein
MDDDCLAHLDIRISSFAISTLSRFPESLSFSLARVRAPSLSCEEQESEAQLHFVRYFYRFVWFLALNFVRHIAPFISILFETDYMEGVRLHYFC